MRTHLHHAYPPSLEGEADRLHHVGAPIMPGMQAQTSSQGAGGAARVAAASAPLNASFPNNLTFFFWLVLIGVVIPGLVVGGLKAGGFQFVFRGR